MSADKTKRRITVAIDARTYRGLRFEARLLNQVFGAKCRPEDVAAARLARGGK